MGLAELRADAKLVRERLAAQADIDIKHELTENVLPLFEALVDAIHGDVVEPLADLEETVDQIVDQSSDVLHPETAARIAGVIELGKSLAGELEALLSAGKVDDVSKKRIKQLVRTYRQGAEVAGNIIAEITIPLEDLPQAQPTDAASDDDAIDAGGETVGDAYDVDDDVGDDPDEDDDDTDQDEAVAAAPPSKKGKK
jgi:hypothetical protein